VLVAGADPLHPPQARRRVGEIEGNVEPEEHFHARHHVTVCVGDRGARVGAHRVGDVLARARVSERALLLVAARDHLDAGVECGNLLREAPSARRRPRHPHDHRRLGRGFSH
jgi:hypothetical protein